MRLNRLTLLLGLLLVSPALFIPHQVVAQDEFGDEFDDEFDAPEPASSAAPSESAPSDDEFGDLEDDVEADTSDAEPAGAEPADGIGDTENGDTDFGDESASETSDEPPAADAPTDAEAANAYRERRFLLHNTWGGSVGGFHVVDAGSGADATFRAQLGLNFHATDGWLLNPGAGRGDGMESNSHIGGSLSLSWSPLDFLEVYAALGSYANSNPQEDPSLFQVLGDTSLGVKGFYRLMPWLFVGGDLNLALLNTVGDIGVVGDSTSLGIRLNATADLRELESSPLPLIARLNLQYYVDNSGALVRDAEAARYRALPDARPCPGIAGAEGDCLEDRHLVTRVERYALQINRVDRFTIGLGLEAPLQVMENFTVSPIVEWVMHVPVNRQGYSCLFIPGTGTPDVPGLDEDGCLDKQGVSAFPQTLTLGVRVLPPIRGMSLFAAVDIGLTGVNAPVRELAGQEPYNVMLGFGYAFDTIPQVRIEEREVVREVVHDAEPDPMGRVVATVVEEGLGTPVSGAIVAYTNFDFTHLSTSVAGGFTTHELEPGEVQFTITHPEYNEGACAATIGEEGGDVELRCELTALPRVGSVVGHVVGDDGADVAGATVELRGPSTHSLTTGSDGTFRAEDLPPGHYTARVESESYLIKQDSFDVQTRERADPEITLVSRPRRSLVRVRARQISIRRQVNFATNNATILDNSTQLLAEIADVLHGHPELTLIEIQGHTDNRGGQQHNQDLSQRRAEAVRDWLVNAGIDTSRLQARGLGQAQPLVPNITASNRARNRRVQFVIQSRTEESE